MKIILCTTPLRPTAPQYPPFGIMAIMQHVRRFGYDPIFYDIDTFRPPFEQVISYFKTQNPDLIGVSAVVSTAYAYTQKLCLALKQALPKTPIVLGGNLAASAELLHRRCKVDLCCISDGENPFLNVIRLIEKYGELPKPEVLRQVKGITFIDESDNFVFTGYDIPIPASEFLDPDFSILERFSIIDNYVNDPFLREDFIRDPRSYEPHRRGQKKTILVSTKGCVSRCTFCHRFDKGYRVIPPQVVVRRMKYLQDRYNVGFFDFGEENFGSDRELTEELIELIKPMNILYSLGGVRCRTANPAFLQRLKESGCTGIYYGMESGSPGILQTMEKNTSLQDNLNAARWTEEAGLFTCYQLVLAMPGETKKTIDETIDFVKNIIAPRAEPPHTLLSTNYIQALPGTPVYELARQKGLIGKRLEDEEAYLIRISDVNAHDDNKFLNFTEEDYFTVVHWRHKILLEAERHWFKVHHWNPPQFRLPDGNPASNRDYYTQGGYFNIKKIFHSPIFYRYFWFLRPLYYVSYVLAKAYTVFPLPVLLKMIGEYVVVRFKKRAVAISDYRSVRRLVKEAKPLLANPSEQSMQILREGQ